MKPIEVSVDWRAKLDGLLDRRPQALVVSCIVIASLLFLVAAARGRAAQIAPPAVASPESSAAPAGSVLVHIAGAVAAPGLYELPSGARVADAIEAAGGARPKADLDALNLAQVVIDGMKVLVVVRSADPTPANAPGSSGSLVSINSADAAALESIPGIGPVTSAAIIEYRQRVGGFGAIDDLIGVAGIGPATLEALRPYVSL